MDNRSSQSLFSIPESERCCLKIWAHFDANLLQYKRHDRLTSSTATLTPGQEIGPLGRIIEIYLKKPSISM